MANVFNNPYATQTPSVWSLQNCFIYAQGQNGGQRVVGGILVSTQSVQIQFSRQLSKRYPLTGGSPITLVGIPQGTCQLTTIMGPDSQVDQFLGLFGSTCNLFDMEISTDNAGTPDPSCTTKQLKQSFKVKNCSGQAVNVQLTMQNNILVAQGTFNIQFDVLEWDNK